MEYKYLVCTDANNNNNKYYEMRPNGDTWEARYGRMGNAGYQSQTYSASQFVKKYQEKLKKGYIDRTNLKSELVIEKKAVDNPDGLAQISQSAIARIVRRLQEFATKTIRANYDIAEAVVTQAMVDEAQDVINAMVSDHSVKSFNEDLIHLISVIPRKVKRVADYLAKDSSDFAKIIQKEQDLLDTLSGNIYRPTVATEPKTNGDKKESETILEKIGVEMEEINDADIQLIKKELGKDSYRFVDAWKVSNKETETNFKKFISDYKIKDTRMMWHGSRSENFFSIIKTGLKIRPSNAAYTGSMFSDGLYFSTLASKSINYTSLSGSYWAHGGNSTGFMALFEVAYGTPYVVYQHTSECYHFNFEALQKKSPPCHCVYASAEKGMLRNPEIVFYRPEQVTIRYLVEIK